MGVEPVGGGGSGKSDGESRPCAGGSMVDVDGLGNGSRPDERCPSN